MGEGDDTYKKSHCALAARFWSNRESIYILVTHPMPVEAESEASSRSFTVSDWSLWLGFYML
jgi:hypothetical protein